MKFHRLSARWLWGLLIALFVLGSGSVLWDHRAREKARTIHLPNGITLKLEAVTYGRKHRFANATLWQSMLIRLAPPSLRTVSQGPQFQHQRVSRVPGHIHEYTSKRDGTLAFWLRGNGGTTFLNTMRNDLRAVVRNETGEDFETAEFSPVVHINGDEFVAILELSAFPRRGKTLTLEFFKIDRFGNSGIETKPLARFTVPNPDRKRLPAWESRPLPQTNRLGELNIVLSELVLDRKPVVTRNARYSPEIIFKFLVFEEEVPSSDWECGGIVLRDATGNVWDRKRSLGRSRTVKGTLRPVIQGVFAPNESAWNIEAEFYRSYNFSPGEIWEVNGLAVTGSPPQLLTNVTAHINGVNLKLDNATTLMGPRAPGHLAIEVAADAPGLEFRVILIEARNPEGKALNTVMNAFLPDRNAQFFSISPAPASTIDMSFAVVRIRKFEFLAKPRIIGIEQPQD
jgi:hypothetical protein